MGEQATAQIANAALLPAPVEASVLQRKCDCGNHTIAGGECDSCKKEKGSGSGNTLQRATSHPGEVDEVPPIVHDVLRSPGQPLDAATRTFFEPRFGHDFSRVRVHTDGHAAESTRVLNAQAYTVGDDLVFAAGEYRPQASEGKRLFAHELTHVIQQRNTTYSPGVQHSLRVGDEDDPAEREADAMAARCLASPAPQASQQASHVTASPTLSRVTTSTIQRKVSPKMSTIEEDLYTGFTDWAIRDKEAHEVLEILKGLSEEDLKDTVAEMEKKKLVDPFFRNIPKKDLAPNQELLARIKNARVYEEVTKKDGKKVVTKTTGSCSPKQTRRIASMLAQSLSWLSNAIGKIDAYLATPNDKSTAKTLQALKDEFKTGTANVATYVRGQLARFQADLRARNLYAFECHEKWDLSCRASGAYVPGDDREKVVFCPTFFKGAITDWDIAGFLHEIAHTQVGGTHITDRAYSSNRMLKHLTTEEALINAESYARFTQQLISGSAPGSAAPGDTYEDCKKTGWTGALQKALARAQRWNRDAQVAIDTLTPAEAKKYSAADRTLLGGTTEKDIESLQKAVNKLADKLKSGISFQCEPKGGGRCDRHDTYWYAIGDLHICPTWVLKSADEQVVALLAGLYGYTVGVDDNTKRLNYARFAQTRTKDPAPSLQRILGDAAWTPDLLGIWLFPKVPTAPDSAYHESGTVHERMSADIPDYHVAPCHSNALPFEASVVFTVDPATTSRPAPFTPPSVKVEFRYMGQHGPITKTASDRRVDYDGPGVILDTKFDPAFKFTFNHNGPFWMRFELNDPDSGVTRVYEDTIRVETSSLCDIPDKRHRPDQPSDTELA